MKHPLQLVTFPLPGLIPSALFHLRLLQGGVGRVWAVSPYPVTPTMGRPHSSNLWDGWG